MFASSARRVAIAAAGLVGSALIGSGVAQAAVPMAGPGWVGVILSHEETVVASRLDVGNVLDGIFGSNRRVQTSSYYSAYPTYPHAIHGGPMPTSDQVIDEAASVPRSTVSFVFIAPSAANYPPYLLQQSLTTYAH